MRILGIDLGISKCAFVMVTDGTFEGSVMADTESGDGSREAKLNAIYKVALIQIGAADVVAIEGYAMGARFGREQMGEVGGVLRLACHQHQKTPVIWQPTSWMKLTCGNGRIAKDKIRLEVFKRYGVDLETTHEVDAFGVAMAEHLAQSGAKRPRPKKRKPTQEVVA